ncbi:WLM-domain-containing protein [Daedalea quercina L-15889]|uniref:WLM-domain-containing protein n=1 Tax=Daedalea quercina L-15889 TaxID=1314783 RepID=A0A165T6M1_9APHY|nr:WLM-domain-containing protein [Daedalea quercina L-15889]
MVHVRLNERETNPNPQINFITALPMPDAAEQEEARQLLRALAAQVRPIMKAHGFAVNSLEEYEHNRVFAGRNWNNGEAVELVLRGKNGSFLPVSWLMSTLCHELAHIQHMNHGLAFQALWAKLRAEVRELQSKGYYGDGYWSSGRRLADSSRIGGVSLEPGDLPEFMCGGAQARKRPTSQRRRCTGQAAGPSNHTGAQTAKKRKAGSRVTAKDTFRGSGHALSEDVNDEEQKKSGAGFRRKAGSKRAREERALAAERRLGALQGEAGPSTQSPEEDDEDSDVEIVPETDQERRRTMLDATAQNDLDALKSSQTDFFSDFIFPPMSPTTDDGKPSCDVQVLPRPSATAASGAGPSASHKNKQRDNADAEVSPRAEEAPTAASGTSPRKKTTGNVSYGNLIQEEMKQRTLESLGLTGSGRRLGGDRKAPTQPHGKGPASKWSCLVCTLSNAPGHLACAACATPRGESTWTGHPS